jgi:hypothetical protein
MMRTPGFVFRASHVLVFLTVISILSFGLYVSMQIMTTPGTSVIAPFIEGLRLRP